MRSRLLAADHRTVAALQTHTAAGADIEMVDAAGLQGGSAAQVVTVVRITAIDDVVARCRQREELRQKLVDAGSRHHQPDGAWRFQSPDPFMQRRGAANTERGERRDALRLPIVDHAIVLSA